MPGDSQEAKGNGNNPSLVLRGEISAAELIEIMRTTAISINVTINNFPGANPHSKWVISDNKGGDMGDENYVDNQNANIAAQSIGKKSKAIAQDTHQAINVLGSKKDAAALAEELDQLINALKTRATDPSEFRATAAIGDAAKAARKGDNNGVIRYLKEAGSWALDVAKELTLRVVASAIEKAMGLGGA